MVQKDFYVQEEKQGNQKKQNANAKGRTTKTVWETCSFTNTHKAEYTYTCITQDQGNQDILEPNKAIKSGSVSTVGGWQLLIIKIVVGKSYSKKFFSILGNLLSITYNSYSVQWLQNSILKIAFYHIFIPSPLED